MNERLRIGDAEREAAAHELGEHFAMGRITAEEHSERLEQIWSARTAADLAPAFADLPRPRPAEPAAGDPVAVRWSRSRSAPAAVPFPMKLLIALVVVVLVFTHLPLILVGAAGLPLRCAASPTTAPPALTTRAGADPAGSAQTSMARLTQTSPTSMPTFW